MSSEREMLEGSYSEVYEGERADGGREGGGGGGKGSEVVMRLGRLRGDDGRRM
jgi:hypothetical protein